MRYIFRKNQFQDDDCDTLFNVRGEVLCHMNVDDFLWRSPSAGAFLHENLDVWKMGECLSVQCVWKMGVCQFTVSGRWVSVCQYSSVSGA